MRELRSNGFTNREIMILISGRWKEATIKGFTRGVEVTKTAERDRVLQTYSRFTAAGKTIQDLDDYLGVNDYLESIGISLKVIAKFIMDMTAQKINLAQFTRFYNETEDSDFSVEEISEGLRVLNLLGQQEISLETLSELNQATSMYGGLQGVTKAILEYHSLQDIEKAKTLAEDILKSQQNEIHKIESEIETLHARSLRIISYMNVTEELVDNHSFDIYSLNMLMQAAGKFGNPMNILEAINIYESLDEIRKEILAVRVELKRLSEGKKAQEAELEALNRFIEKANRAIGEIEASHKKSLTVQAIAEIIDGSVEIEIDPLRFKQTSLRFLLGINQYAKQHSSVLSDWEKAVGFYLNYVIEGLSKIQ
jgi:hypothetical protein